jgi:hypothetical protein
VSRFDWGRKGPPRPGSGSVAHPQGVERPYVHVTAEEKARKGKTYREIAKERGRAIRAADWKARFGTDYPG